MYSLLPLIILADWILNTVFNFVVFYIFGLVTIPFILIFDLENVFP